MKLFGDDARVARQNGRPLAALPLDKATGMPTRGKLSVSRVGLHAGAEFTPANADVFRDELARHAAVRSTRVTSAAGYTIARVLTEL